MNLKYYLYLAVCYITHPFRWLMPKYTNFEFAIRYLFKNDFTRAWVYCQSAFETGSFTSNLCVNYKNYFGIGKSKLQQYQSSSTPYLGSNPLAPSNFAAYRSVYQSVYYYFDWCSNPSRRVNSLPSIQQGLNDVMLAGTSTSKVPDLPYEIDSIQGLAIIKQYFNACGFAFKTASFFGEGVVPYTNGCISKTSEYTPSNWRYYVNYLYTLLFFTFVGLCTFNPRYRSKIKGKISKIIH